MIEGLRRFILVAKNGNISKTAQEIFITQSALSQSIQRLEREIGTKLFTQRGKILHLTPDGAAIVEIGTKIIDLWQKAKNQNIRNSPKSTYSVGIFDSAAIKLGKYFSQNSKNNFFNLEIITGASGKLLSQLKLGILDVAVCVIDKTNLHAKDIILVKAFTEELIPVSSKKFSRNADNIPFILYNKDSHTRNQIDNTFIKNGIAPNIFAESTSITFMKELALLGSGIALLPKNYVQVELKQEMLKEQKLPFKLQREYGIFISKNGRLRENSQIIGDLIKNLS